MVAPNKNVALNIIARRTALGLDQKELALSAGVDPIYLNKIERLRRNAGPNVLEKLAKFFGCTREDLEQRAPTEGYKQMLDLIVSLQKENDYLRSVIRGFRSPPDKPKPKK